MLRPNCTMVSEDLMLERILETHWIWVTWEVDFLVVFKSYRHSYGSEDSKMVLMTSGSFLSVLMILSFFISF